MRPAAPAEPTLRPDDPEAARLDALATGRRVLATEAAALTLFADSLDDGFAAAVDLLYSAAGRVVVSGMGKSGHVGRKIAATMASTGTPAFFVHPGEASHGDLGMIRPRDVALVLSNSGETRELADLLAHCKREHIPIVGIAGRANSTLLRAADAPLLLPPAEEACSIRLAPTTSTTLTLALGDALAVALMERRGFTPEHYALFHPGGSLGAQLARVADVMAVGERLPLVFADAPMADALIAMSAKGFGVTGVIDPSGRLVGIITDGDLRRHMDGLVARRAGDVATHDPRTIRPDRLASEALARMTALKITCLFVTDADPPSAPIGLVHLHDCLRAGIAGPPDAEDHATV
ncbi:MAG: KpsF/GutQ family sugar-phosphate isomerase [Pseudomonadota bacterium]